MAAITANQVCKSFRVAKQRTLFAKEVLRRILMRPSGYDQHWALRDVSFEIADGESVGVVGANGSGKSTLLSLIAKTSYPTFGTVEVTGRVGPLLELGAGFHHSLTGAENIRLNAALLGLSADEVEARFDKIVEYAGIGPFLDAPIHTYSSGMYARLGFAVLAHIDPDVLIVDEALAVGDFDFQQKCERTMRGMLEKGTTMFLVSHDLALVQKLCQRAIWLHKGRMRMIGPCAEVVHEYTHTWHLLAAEDRADAEAEKAEAGAEGGG